jgi:hypothetical protein
VDLISLWVGMGWVEIIKMWDGVDGRRELICYGIGWVRGGFSPIAGLSETAREPGAVRAASPGPPLTRPREVAGRWLVPNSLVYIQVAPCLDAHEKLEFFHSLSITLIFDPCMK